MEFVVKNKLVILILFVITSASYHNLSTAADFSAESNIVNFSYPPHPCKQKPTRPAKPMKMSSYKNSAEYYSEVSKYNIKVQDYNSEIKRYKSCINQYINNGNNDIRTIRQQLNSALKEARQNKLPER